MLTRRDRLDAYMVGATLGLYIAYALFGPLFVLVMLIWGPWWAALPLIFATALAWIGWWKQFHFAWSPQPEHFRRR